MARKSRRSRHPSTASSGAPSAAQIAEARAWLSAHGRNPDGIDLAASLRDLIAELSPLNADRVQDRQADPWEETAENADPKREAGGTGIRAVSGFLYEDPNPDLRAPQKWDVFEAMRTHGGVQGAELAIRFPCQRVEWWIDPMSQDPLNIEAAEVMGSNLFSGMATTWAGIMGEWVLSVLYGVNCLEKIFSTRADDGLTVLADLAPRHPRTIWRWILTEQGRWNGIRQRLVSPHGMYYEVPISPDKLIKFTFRGEGGNPEGAGLLRGVYMHWKMLVVLYKLQAIGFERTAIGLPVGHLPQNFSPADSEALLQILRSWRVNEVGGVVLPQQYAIEIIEGKRSPADITPTIEHHSMQIGRGMLALYLNLGTSTTGGSRAMGQVLIDSFAMAIDGMLAEFAERFQRDVIDVMAGFNWPSLKLIPRLCCGSVRDVLQPSALADMLQKAVSSGYLMQDPQIGDKLRLIWGLPPAAEDITTSGSAEDERAVDDTADAPAARRASVSRRTPYRSLLTGPFAGRQMRAIALGRHLVGPDLLEAGHRPLRYVCGRGWQVGVSDPPAAPPLPAASSRTRQRPRDDAHFVETQARLSAAKGEFQEIMKRICDKQRDALATQIAPILGDYRAADDLHKGTVLGRLDDLEVGYQGEYSNAVANWMRQFYADALSTAAETAGVTPPETVPNAMRTWINETAGNIAADHASQLLTLMRRQALTVARISAEPKRILWQADNLAKARQTTALRDDLRAAGTELLDQVERTFLCAEAES